MINYLIILFITNILIGVPLQDVYDSSYPANGYDKYIILESDVLYEGGIGIYEGSVYLDCNSAIIDLQQGNGIWVYSDEYYPSSLYIQNCTIMNGEY